MRDSISIEQIREALEQVAEVEKVPGALICSYETLEQVTRITPKTLEGCVSFGGVQLIPKRWAPHGLFVDPETIPSLLLELLDDGCVTYEQIVQAVEDHLASKGQDAET